MATGRIKQRLFFVNYVYANKDVNITGTYENDEYEYKTIFDMKMKKGWNIVIEYQKEETDGSTTLLTATEPVPAGAKWEWDR